MMTNSVVTWIRCEELAEGRGVTITIGSHFVLTDRTAKPIGHFDSVDEVYAFLCGYEHGINRTRGQ